MFMFLYINRLAINAKVKYTLLLFYTCAGVVLAWSKELLCW